MQGCLNGSDISGVYGSRNVTIQSCARALYVLPFDRKGFTTVCQKGSFEGPGIGQNAVQCT